MAIAVGHHHAGKLNEAIGRDLAIASKTITPGVSELTLTDGSAIFLARRYLGSPLGELAITQRRAVVLGSLGKGMAMPNRSSLPYRGTRWGVLCHVVEISSVRTSRRTAVATG